MSATNYTLRRHKDVSAVSGTGPVATICEFSSGLVAMHWDTATPSIEIHTDIRHIEALHGHKGASTLELIGGEVRAADELTDAQIDADLKTIPGYDPADMYPEYDCTAIRAAYRAGYEAAS